MILNMPNRDGFQHGEFCWFELATTDQEAAKTFYNKVFGWTPNDQPMGPDAFYTILELNGRDVGALYNMQDSERQMGLPTHWNTYVCVDSADETAAKAEKLGAKILMAPFDVMEHGRASVIQDPTDAVFIVWEPKNHRGARVIDEDNAFCWYELATNDTAAAKSFYTNLFGWSTKDSPEYIEWQRDGKSIGGLMKIQPEWGPVPPNWIDYVMTNDLDAKCESVKANGGKVVVGPIDIPQTGRFATVQDPQGGHFSIFEPMAR